MDGVEATRLTPTTAIETLRIVMLTTFDDDEYVYRALEYGAVGCLLKNIPPEELFACIRAVHGGAMLISPSVARETATRSRPGFKRRRRARRGRSRAEGPHSEGAGDPETDSACLRQPPDRGTS